MEFSTEELRALERDNRTWSRLSPILATSDFDDVAYVYRLGRRGKPRKPYLLKWYGPSEDLIFTLQSEHGGGEFRILIRRGNQMIFSGEIAVAAALNRRY